MAIIPNASYPTQTTAPDANYPFGGAQNITVAGDDTGTPWEANLLNDIFGFQQALLNAGGVVPSGIPDTAIASDYLNALFGVLTTNNIRNDSDLPGGYLTQALNTVPSWSAAQKVLQSGPLGSSWVSDTIATYTVFEDSSGGEEYCTLTVDLTVILGSGDDVHIPGPLPVNARPLSDMTFALFDTDSGDSGISRVKCTVEPIGALHVIKESGGINYTGRHTGTIMYKVD